MLPLGVAISLLTKQFPFHVFETNDNLFILKKYFWAKLEQIYQNSTKVLAF